MRHTLVVLKPPSSVSLAMSISGGPLLRHDQATLRTRSSFSVKVTSVVLLEAAASEAGVPCLVGDGVAILRIWMLVGLMGEGGQYISNRCDQKRVWWTYLIVREMC